jgi:hypothetical protein
VLFVTAIFVLLTSPSAAFAVMESSSLSPVPIRLGTSLLGLIVAVLLLIETLGVRKFMAGGALADKISYVLLAILCLAASALAQWTQNFVDGVTLAQVQMASQYLVIMAMVLLALYFAGVRSALSAYLKAMTGTQMLMQDQPRSERNDERG